MRHSGLRLAPDIIDPSAIDRAHLSRGNIDGLGRKIDYLRISITDRCNLRCVYCMPEEGLALSPRDDLLAFEEFWRVAEAAHKLGFKKFRVTGGEPLVVKNVLVFLQGLRRVTGDSMLCLTTNGTLLGHYLEDLRTIGVTRLNVSLDTLDPVRFKTLARRDGLDEVLSAIEIACSAGFEVKINTVIVPGINEVDIIPLAKLAQRLPIDVRFIEQMPLDGEVDGGFMSADEIARRIHRVYPLKQIAPQDLRQAAQTMHTSDGFRGRIGVIAPRSQKFCASCNRMRLTSHGELKGCLLSEGTLDIKQALRSGVTDDDLTDLLRYAIGIKPAEYKNERYGLDRSMSAIGG
ncbi:MAG: GTP 3',8-cyclase MoaA [Clostridia bacterium]|nr:GTP 3',8-cyclase MoaA [Deltaproteobacteria bacterium]